MKLHLITFLIALMLPVFVFGQEKPDYELILEEGMYKAGESRLNFILTVKNNTHDTLVMVRPTFVQFREHYSFQSVNWIGETRKPYSLELIVKEDCEGETEWMAPVQDYPKMVYMRQSNLLIVPPGELSRKHYLFVNLAEFEFCAEGVYEARVTYNPGFETLNDEQLKFLNKKKKELDKLATEAQRYIEKEALSPDTINTSGTLLNLVLDHDRFIHSITPGTLSSQQIPLIQK